MIGRVPLMGSFLSFLPGVPVLGSSVFRFWDVPPIVTKASAGSFGWPSKNLTHHRCQLTLVSFGSLSIPWCRRLRLSAV